MQCTSHMEADDIFVKMLIYYDLTHESWNSGATVGVHC
jgi:hypothetical protein